MKIRQSSNLLLTLLKEVHAGRMLPAGMQRPYVRRRHDVEALCDSILSGFPIGAFLLWLPSPSVATSAVSMARLGPIESAPAGEGHVHLLLDGQNRLASLAWMMAKEAPGLSDASPAERETWLGDERLVLDYSTRSMRFVPADEAEVGLRLPAWTMVATTGNDQYHEAMVLVRKLSADDGLWAKQYPEETINAFLEFWDRSRDRFTDARTTETIIEDATIEEARHAFLRICRVGVPMSAEDFNRAVGWSGSSAGDASTVTR